MGKKEEGKKRPISIELQVNPHPKKPKNEEELGPFIVNLASAAPDAQQELEWEFDVFGEGEPGSSNPLYLVSGQPGANLIGTTQELPQAAAHKATYAVALYNRRKNTICLAPAAGGTVVRLEAQAAHVTDADVAGLEPDLTQRQQQQERPKDLDSRRADARRLVEAFGSTRRKRQLKQREEAKVVVEVNADEERLEMMMKEVAAKAAAAGETRQEVMARVGAARVIPPHNPKAVLPHKAYNMNNIFPEALRASVNIGQLLYAAEKEEDRQRLASRGMVPGYVISRLQRLSDASDIKEKKQRARSLALLAALLQLAAARPKLTLKPPRPAAEEGGKPRPGGLQELAGSLRIGRPEVLEPLLTMFYNKSFEGGSTTYVREEYKAQLLLMHVLVCALDVEGWTMAPEQFDALRKELKMTAADVVSRFRELGCTCTAAKLAPGVGPDGTPTGSIASYTVALLPAGTGKTLEESFPRPKSAPKQRGR